MSTCILLKAKAPLKKSTASETSLMTLRKQVMTLKFCHRAQQNKAIKRYSHPFPPIIRYHSALTMLLPNENKFEIQLQYIPPNCINPPKHKNQPPLAYSSTYTKLRHPACRRCEKKLSTLGFHKEFLDPPYLRLPPLINTRNKKIEPWTCIHPSSLVTMGTKG